MEIQRTLERPAQPGELTGEYVPSSSFDHEALRSKWAVDGGRVNVSCVDAQGTTPTLEPLPSRRLLLVEQDAALTRFLSRGLSSEYSVDVVHDGEAALGKALASHYDLVLFELNLPVMDGMTLLGEVRRRLPQQRMMVLTARSEALVGAFEQGADDFLKKPFSFVELVARMRALLRRVPDARPTGSESQRIGDLTVNRQQYKVDRNGRGIELTPREFAILESLIGHAGRPVSRVTLMEEVWKAPFNPASNIVDVYMKYLRDKIDGDGEEKLIRTVRGVGYALTDRTPPCAALGANALPRRSEETRAGEVAMEC